MSLIGTALSFLTGLFGIAYASAVLIAQEPTAAPAPGGSSVQQQPGTQQPGALGAPSTGFPGGQGGQLGPGPGGFGGHEGPGSFGLPGGQFGGPGGRPGGEFKGDFKGREGEFKGREGEFGGHKGFPGGQGGEFGGPGGFPGGGPGGEFGGPGGEQFGGPGGEFGEEMGRRQEEEGNKRCLQDIKKGMAQFEKSGLKQLENKVKKAAQKGITVPADIQEAVDKMRSSIEKVKATETCEDAQTAMEEVMEGQVGMDELFMRIEFLTQAPKIIKQISLEFKRMDTAWQNAVKKAAKSKVDLSEQIAKGQAIRDELNAMFEAMKAAVASGNFDQMQDMMETGEGAHEKQEELMEIIQTIEAIRNTGRMIQGLNQHLNGLKRAAKDLKRRKVDVTELNACIDNAKTNIDTVKAVASGKPVDIDALVEAFEGAQDALDQCEDLGRQARGEEEESVFEDFFDAKTQKNLEKFGGPPRGEGGPAIGGGGGF